jgi:hypothetical protein
MCIPAPIDDVFTLYAVAVGLISVEQEQEQEQLQCACGGYARRLIE